MEFNQIEAVLMGIEADIARYSADKDTFGLEDAFKEFLSVSDFFLEKGYKEKSIDLLEYALTLSLNDLALNGTSHSILDLIIEFYSNQRFQDQRYNILSLEKALSNVNLLSDRLGEEIVNPKKRKLTDKIIEMSKSTKSLPYFEKAGDYELTLGREIESIKNYLIAGKVEKALSVTTEPENIVSALKENPELLNSRIYQKTFEVLSKKLSEERFNTDGIDYEFLLIDLTYAYAQVAFNPKEQKTLYENVLSLSMGRDDFKTKEIRKFASHMAIKLYSESIGAEPRPLINKPDLNTIQLINSSKL